MRKDLKLRDVQNLEQFQLIGVVCQTIMSEAVKTEDLMPQIFSQIFEACPKNVNNQLC